MSEFEHEPIRGLPGHLPKGETILWQGAPCAQTLAVHALHVRAVALYFLGLTVWRGFEARVEGLEAVFAAGLWTMLLGAAALTILGLFAWGVERTTVYTITSRRVVMRIGVALEKAVNIPFSILERADLRRHADGRGDIALSLAPTAQAGYLTLWPHARPLRFSRPEPMLRAVPDAQAVADILARAVAAETERRRDAAVKDADDQSVAPNWLPAPVHA